MSNKGQSNFDNTNRGSAFINDRKEKETQPDMTGKVNIEGTEYYASLWTRESKKNVTYMSVALREVREDMSGSPQFNGALWKNDKKKEDKHPDFTGKLDEVPFRMAVWVTPIQNGDRAGESFFSFQFTKDEESSDKKATGTDGNAASNGKAPEPTPEEPAAKPKLPF